PLSASLFPYTTLFRSRHDFGRHFSVRFLGNYGQGLQSFLAHFPGDRILTQVDDVVNSVARGRSQRGEVLYRPDTHDYLRVLKERSEEHTSELQSRVDL